MDLSAATLFAAFGVSSVGLGLFLYGKKQMRLPQLVCGIAMMGFPYVVTSPLWIVGIGAGMVGGLWAVTRAGL